MSKDSKIEWCHHSFNYVWGCTKISDGCKNCYAAAWDKRVGGDHWGVNKERRIMSDSYWQQPLKWNKAAEKAGERHRVFCSSMADVFDIDSPRSERERLFNLIKITPHLDWLLLTKRPENILSMLPSDWGNGYRNVWLGTSVENQDCANYRIPELLKVPAIVRFLSCEPLLAPIDLKNIIYDRVVAIDALEGLHGFPVPHEPNPGNSRIDWVIVGGESGNGARPMHPEWVRQLRHQCVVNDVNFFFKQHGDWIGVDQLDSILSPGETVPSKTKEHVFDDGTICMKLGKKFNGRLLDGVEWNEFPEVK